MQNIEMFIKHYERYTQDWLLEVEKKFFNADFEIIDNNICIKNANGEKEKVDDFKKTLYTNLPNENIT